MLGHPCVQVHRQLAETVDAVGGHKVRVVLVAGVAAGARHDDQVFSVDDGAVVHEALRDAVGPARHAARGEPVQAVDAVVEEEPAALVARGSVLRLGPAVFLAQQVLGVGHQVAEHPVHVVGSVVDDKKLALSVRAGRVLGEAQAIGFRVVVEDGSRVCGGVLVYDATREDSDAAGDLDSVGLQSERGAPPLLVAYWIELPGHRFGQVGPWKDVGQAPGSRVKRRLATVQAGP